MLGHHDRSVIEADNALDRRPGYVYGHVFKISALLMMGEHARAREASAALLQVRPNFDPATLEWLPFKDRSWNRRPALGPLLAPGYQARQHLEIGRAHV